MTWTLKPKTPVKAGTPSEKFTDKSGNPVTERIFELEIGLSDIMTGCTIHFVVRRTKLASKQDEVTFFLRIRLASSGYAQASETAAKFASLGTVTNMIHILKTRSSYRSA